MFLLMNTDEVIVILTLTELFFSHFLILKLKPALIKWITIYIFSDITEVLIFQLNQAENAGVTNNTNWSGGSAFNAIRPLRKLEKHEKFTNVHFNLYSIIHPGFWYHINVTAVEMHHQGDRTYCLGTQIWNYRKI